MKTRNQIGVYVPISVVFPEVQNDFATFQSLLSGLSRTDSLFWCARLNLLVSAKTDVDSMEAQQFGLNQFFRSNEIEAINDFARSHGGARRIKVFFRGQLLELFRWAALLCIDHPGDGTTYEDPEVRRKFAQAAMIASDVRANRIFKDKFSFEGCQPNGAFSAFGQAFEEYILDVLDRMFASPEHIVNRLAKNVQVLDSRGDYIEVDAILNDAVEVVLFEIK